MNKCTEWAKDNKKVVLFAVIALVIFFNVVFGASAIAEQPSSIRKDTVFLLTFDSDQSVAMCVLAPMTEDNTIEGSVSLFCLRAPAVTVEECTGYYNGDIVCKENPGI